MYRKISGYRLAALLFCTGASSAFAADDGVFSLGLGYNYSSGDYGTTTTTKITSIPLTARYDTGPWTLKLTIPYLYISGGTGAIPGIGQVVNTNPTGRGRSTVAATTTTTTTASASGLGDVVAAVTYNAYNNSASGIGIDLTGKIKFGTADKDKGLGTGENDYAAQVDAYKSFGKFTLFGGIGYAALGSSQFISLDNVFNITAGGNYKLDDRSTVGMTFDAREKVSATAHPLREATAYWAYKINKSWKAQAYALKGFADGSPDWGVGASAAYAF